MLIEITEEEYQDFMDEPDTQPFVHIDVVQCELDSAESVVHQFTARAQANGYSVDPPKHWTERLEEELEVMPVQDEDVISIEDFQ